MKVWLDAGMEVMTQGLQPWCPRKGLDLGYR